ncbi:MAG TPA: hypothetical protein VK447_04515 [Myxococcaceae bacterium]|nr:hypothetical protein [Myxococcaceae bacterium]
MRALKPLPEEEQTVACACCGTPVPYRMGAAGVPGKDAKPRCVSCPTCGYKYRLTVVRTLPLGGLTVRPNPI